MHIRPIGSQWSTKIAHRSSIIDEGGVIVDSGSEREAITARASLRSSQELTVT